MPQLPKRVLKRELCVIWAPIEKFKELTDEGKLTPTLRRISDVLLSGESFFKLWAACCMTEKSHPASLAPRKAAGPAAKAQLGCDVKQC
jgi:hypothetical protein